MIFYFIKIPLSTSKNLNVCDITTGVPWPFIPKQLHPKVFDSLHSLFHPGICTTQKLATDRYISILMLPNGQDPVYHARDLRSKDIKSPSSTFATPDVRFNQVLIDIMGPLPMVSVTSQLA